MVLHTTVKFSHFSILWLPTSTIILSPLIFLFYDWTSTILSSHHHCLQQIYKECATMFFENKRIFYVKNTLISPPPSSPPKPDQTDHHRSHMWTTKYNHQLCHSIPTKTPLTKPPEALSRADTRGDNRRNLISYLIFRRYWQTCGTPLAASGCSSHISEADLSYRFVKPKRPDSCTSSAAVHRRKRLKTKRPDSCFVKKP